MHLRFVIIILCFFSLFIVHPEKLILTNKKVAKVGDKYIIKSDVDSEVYKTNVTYDIALRKIINNELLYMAASISVEEPNDKEINSALYDDKFYYASMVGKDVNSVKDYEFLKAINTSAQTITDYKVTLRKRLMINKYIEKISEAVNLKSYYPSDEEITKYIKENPDLFSEKEGAELSMIYFSFYDKNGVMINDENKKLKRDNSLLCIKDITDDNFTQLALKYSDDLITLSAKPVGRLGKIYFDDPTILNRFGSEIIKIFKDSGAGVLKRTFDTKDGIFIFKIDSKIKPYFYPEKDARRMASDYIKYNTISEEKKKIYNEKLKELERKFGVEVY